MGVVFWVCSWTGGVSETAYLSQPPEVMQIDLEPASTSDHPCSPQSSKRPKPFFCDSLGYQRDCQRRGVGFFFYREFSDLGIDQSNYLDCCVLAKQQERSHSGHLLLFGKDRGEDLRGRLPLL